MMRKFVYVLALALVAGTAAQGSDPVGGYLIVDKVILQPSDAPRTIQIWGSFVLATRYNGKEYSRVQRGYLYYEVASGKESLCRKEWNDLKKAAGTGKVIGFGTSYELKAQGTVRKASQKAEKPDVYPLGNGLVKMDSDRDYKPVRDLLSQPKPRSPGNGEVVAPGVVTLNADVKRDGSTFVFVLVGDNGDKEQGTATPRKGGVSWTPKMKLKDGVKYTWSVRAKEDKEGAVSATFTVKDKK